MEHGETWDDITLGIIPVKYLEKSSFENEVGRTILKGLTTYTQEEGT